MNTTRKVRFEPQKYEDAIAQTWEELGVYKTISPDSKESKQYVLPMFPYPSGAGLHTGHARIYTATDVLARYYRMKGEAVLHPMGWDAFGLPAENAAIKQKRDPQSITSENIETFEAQCRRLGLSYDWSRAINTTDPDYFAITQWLFVLFFQHGLLYKKDTSVFYCPFCKTGLAQEEVQADSTHERCGNVVEKRTLPQWIFRIQEYADSLLEGLDGLDWPPGILEMQKNWIGRKDGVEIQYPILDHQGNPTDKTITCFTTRPETNFGATFIVLAPEHPLVQQIISGEVSVPNGASKRDIEDYVFAALRKTERERMADEKTKTGVFTGLYAVNRLNGKKLPVWISDFVLVNVGSGAVVGVPAHDKRDFAFAAKFGIEVVRVVEGPENDRSEITEIFQVHEGDGKIMNSQVLDTMDTQVSNSFIKDYLEKKGWGKKVTTYHLREWIFSRQRYWGEPIPMVFCASCAAKGVSYWDSHSDKVVGLGLHKGKSKKTFGDLVDEVKGDLAGWFPLGESELPLTLPKVDHYEPTETGKSPLSSMTNWVKVPCPHCGLEAERETDTMPNWAGSCWYFLAFASKKGVNVKPQSFFSEARLEDWLPVDWYIGGTEHAVLHLLYARFWMHILNDLGSVKVREPFRRFRSVGIVKAEDGRKMSKSLGNVINPDDIVKEYGADALRVYEMFMAPFSQEVGWSTQTLQGSYRFMRRIWQIYNDTAKITKELESASKELASELQSLISKVGSDITDVKFNTPIAAMMEFLNSWENSRVPLAEEHAGDFLKLLAPFAPFTTDYIWQSFLSREGSIHAQSWPVSDQNLIQTATLELPIQINGKVRDKMVVAKGVSEEEAVRLALSRERVNQWLSTHGYKVIYIQDRILSFVIEGK